jgi:hypothetical protein
VRPCRVPCRLSWPDTSAPLAGGYCGPQSPWNRSEVWGNNPITYVARGWRNGSRVNGSVWPPILEFHQLDNPAGQRSKGLGLGLAIVQRLADPLGRKIDVRSRLGAGSVFTIEGPLGRAEATAPWVLGHAEIPNDVPACGTILIVDARACSRAMLSSPVMPFGRL